MKYNSTENKPGAGRPKRKDKNNEAAPSAEKGTMPGDKRKTYIVKSETADKIDAIAYWDRQTVKDIVDDAFNIKIDKYEKENGVLKPKPKK